MAEIKTKENDASVDEFLNQIADEQQRADSKKLRLLMEEVTGEPAKMWGGSIIGFGKFNYKYKSGTENEWMITGFSPRKANLTLYIMDGYDSYQPLLDKIGKATTAKSCLYIKKLDDVDLDVLKQLLSQSVQTVKSGKLQLG